MTAPDIFDTPAAPARTVCTRCQQPPREDMACEGGWIEVRPYDYQTGTAACMARCKRWEAILEAGKHAAGLVASGLNDAAYAATWEQLDLTHKSFQAAHRIALSIRDVVAQGLNLVFSGQTGTGKTQAGVLICRAAMNAGLSVVKQDWSRFLDGLRDGYNDRSIEPEGKKIDRLVAADFLMLDDIGVGGEDGQKFSTARIEKVITRRYDAKRPTLITANYTTSQLHEVLGDRAASRIEGRVMQIVFNGTVHRQQTERREVSDLVTRLWGGR